MADLPLLLPSSALDQDGIARSILSVFLDGATAQPQERTGR
ncbi:hypothetical protein [Microbacterium sp. Se63.02b]|nr:hypothetical protein [Microbacterium sp. Se63.02b]